MKTVNQTSQGGFALIEALISIAIFSFALIGLVSLQSAAIASTTDAKMRSDAAFLADQIIGQAWSDRGNITNYNHLASGAPCAPGGAASINPTVLAWLGDVSSALPNATDSVQSLAVGSGNSFTVTICWKRPHDATYHRYVVVSQIN